MDPHSNKKMMTTITTNKNPNLLMGPICSNPCCFFCIMKEPDPSLRKSGIAKCFKEIPLTDDQEHVLVLSTLWNIAMTQPNDPEFPSLGIFECMASLIYKGLNDRDWLLRDQNIFIPYYAAHIIGSYTMNKIEFAEKAVKSGVISPLMELLRGKISWVEQRVAVRALGHLASYETTFDSVAENEEEIIELAMDLSSTCLEVVYVKFVAVKDKQKRLRYHCDLLTRGVGGLEMENRKAEEWASQLQCWSIYLLNCFAWKERSLNLICKLGFLKNLCEMWGGSSDDWQYMGIDCLLLLLKDPDTRFKVIEIATLSLVDLVELKTLGGRKKVGEAITEALLLDYKQTKSKFKNNKVVQKALQQVWDLMVEKRKREIETSQEELLDRRVLVGFIKQEANESFWAGDIEEAVIKYTEGLNLCPLKMSKERMVLYSNRAQCYLLLGEPDSAISDSTRALSLSNPANSHNKSLWRRSQAYDLKGLAKESLMDCIMFVNGFFTTSLNSKEMMMKRRVKVPYYASRMINKQMSVTWLFAAAEAKLLLNKHQFGDDEEEVVQSDGYDSDDDEDDETIMKQQEKKISMSAGLSTIVEEEEDQEHLMEKANKYWSRRRSHCESRVAFHTGGVGNQNSSNGVRLLLRNLVLVLELHSPLIVQIWVQVPLAAN
ncbi:hypothetical protein BVC80_7781g5 [Macleaya cordata]|uniref:ARM repeat N-terminal plant domain-containing protein n=1 Tax=Macleaya cordata TaxID=56857 RepID=A0A200R906_MACCD|nr:hypothetical protein BVC80_7781g5 [Macleaya cordata]